MGAISFLHTLCLMWVLFDPIMLQCISDNDTTGPQKDIDITVRAYLNGSLNFGLQMFRVLQAEHNDQTSSGLFFSPFSVWSALAVTFIGTKGHTEHELSCILGIRHVDKAFSAVAYKSIQFWYKERSEKSDIFRLANQLYFQYDIPLRECLVDYFENDVSRLDFRRYPEQARLTINEWVKEQTNCKIENFLPYFSINSMTNFVIANAVYFKGAWRQQFEIQKTRPGIFTTAVGMDIASWMMNMRGTFLYGVNEVLECQVLELPFSGDDFSMVILLPKNRYFGVDSLSRLITPDQVSNIFFSVYPTDVWVSLPKFRSESNFDLTFVLQKMGLRDIFSPRYANLSGFTEKQEVITVDAVHHKAFIEVNEEGAEAAAATGILAARSARPRRPVVFIADHPFFYYIRDNLSNIILFMGTVVHPMYD
ncbi:leukocyte elastase inhibitor-like [Limulus polyphemus]|uniref:Leukocyte elastase inhibitor-like n=1 Tax=Limulus polyphemus TaxID=6850 RepID=A0ABM1BT27_LIMPO|nr:leukocyte elastase inhibitor-like [Limulus polyphemus]